MSPKSFRQRRHQDPENPARMRSKSTTCCIIQRCRGVISAFSQRVETLATDKRDRKSFHRFSSTTRFLVHIRDNHISTSQLELTGFSLDCQNSGIQKSSSSQTVNQRKRFHDGIPSATITAIQAQQSNEVGRTIEQTIRNQIKESLKDPTGEERRNHSPSRQSFAHTVTTTRSMALHAIPQTTRTTTGCDKIRHMPHHNPILPVGEAVAFRRPGAVVNML